MQVNYGRWNSSPGTRRRMVLLTAANFNQLHGSNVNNREQSQRHWLEGIWNKYLK